MKANIVGRVGNTRLANNQALLPLFEAIVNAIHATNDVDSNESLAIEIKLIREWTQRTITESGYLNAIESFEITDNGIGFTEANYESFQTADSRYRAAIGGKGVGRFLWLVAFESVEIDSIFSDEAGRWMHRVFRFRATAEGVEEHSLVATEERQRKTVVRLLRIKEKYQKALPKLPVVIANRIVEHCLQYFLLGTHCSISVVDSQTNEKTDLSTLFSEEVETRGSARDVQVANRNLKLHNLKVRPTYGEGHRLYFCADKRVVRSERLEGKIPNLDGSMKDDSGKSFVYSGYVSGDFLDESVNTERTDFVLPEDEDVLGDPTWKDLITNIACEAKNFLEPYTAPIKEGKEARIQNFVRTKAPTFRPLVKHRPHILDEIPANISDDKLEIELFKLNQGYERSLKEKGELLVASLIQADGNVTANTYDSFLEEWNESGIAKLATHVAYRKATLKILRASLGLNKEAKYSLEEAIHRLIFPLKKTSDDVPADQMNLWIIDERLAYHFYLASDIPFKSLQKDVLDLESKDRSDIVIFNQASAFVEEEAPFDSVVIVEFKRPVRDDYTDDENPITQVYRYVKQIRDGRAKDRHGRPINVKNDIPFYAYIIADITSTLRDQAQFSGFQPNHDGNGYFTFNPQLRVYVELISFDNLVSNAERRNQYFFNQLNLPS